MRRKMQSGEGVPEEQLEGNKIHDDGQKKLPRMGKPPTGCAEGGKAAAAGHIGGR